MRDPVLEEALRRLAAEAATRFSSLVACGEEVPFDVAEDDGNDSFFYRYVPLTHKFVAAHESDLRSLPSYGPACGAINLAGVAIPFLEARGKPVPADPDLRAGSMITAFISELWQGSAEFTLDQTRLDAALAAIEAETRDVHEADLLVVPLVGLQMPIPSLELAGSVKLVRADTIDAPIEAMSSEGMSRQAWEPQFLALVDQGAGPESVDRALAELHDTVTVMRLFRSGDVGLGPFAFAPVADGHWRRVATGAAPVRAGGYPLDEQECGELRELSELLAPRLTEIRDSADTPAGPSVWSLRRFEMGRERADSLQAMTDHLLALRAVLEGDGPVGAPLPVRAAALLVDSPERDEVRGKLEAALRLERDLIAGRPATDAGALALAIWLEDSVRQIIRDSVEGALGNDAGVAADESLLAAGLQEGEGSISQRGDTEEWDALPDPVDAGDAEPAGWRPFELPVELRPHQESVREAEEDGREEVTRIMEPIPNFESEIRVSAMREARVSDDAGLFDREINADAGFVEEPVGFDDEAGFADHDDAQTHDEIYREERRPSTHSDWLSEVSGEDVNTIEWPVGAIRAYRTADDDRYSSGYSDSESVGSAARGRVDTPRVRHLFPAVDDADWSVGELKYQRRRSA